ncbi:MAG TPA: hypothetical protein VIK61_10775 [Acidimicrobiia bacterium]
MSKGHLARFSVSVVAVGALVVVAAACGGSSSAKAATPSTTAAAGGGGANRVAFEAYRTCLSQHGVTLPQRTRPTGSSGSPPPSGSGAGGLAGDGGFGGGSGSGFGGGTPQSLPKGVTAAQFAAAQTACRSKLPSGGLFGGGQGGQAFQAYTSCLRDHGVTISRVAPQTTVAGSPRPTFNRNDPKFVAANKVCAALLPSRTSTTTAG